MWALVVVTLCGRGGGAGKEPSLRASGIEVVVDPDVLVNKRRVKTAAEIEGICRAQKADEAMALGVQLIRDLRPGVTSEMVRSEMQAVCDSRGCDLPDDVIVLHGLTDFPTTSEPRTGSG